MIPTDFLKMKNKEIDDIIRENSSWLRAFVRRNVKNHDDADDIVQDTLYQFVRTIRAIENPIGHVSSWLYTVAHNLIINHSKKNREQTFGSSGTNDDDFMSEISEIFVADDNESPDIRILRSMVWKELDKALAELPKEQREALEMTEINGLSVKEASSMLGIPQNTFLSRKHYAVIHVRKRLFSLYQELIQK